MTLTKEHFQSKALIGIIDMKKKQRNSSSTVTELYDTVSSKYDAIYHEAENQNIIFAENAYLKKQFPIVFAEGDTMNSVLDVGCGTGLFIDIFKDYLDDQKYFGIDISPNMIAEARKKHPTFNFLSWDFMGYKKNLLFDVVTSLFAVADYCGFDGIKKCCDHLKSNGILFLTAVNAEGGYVAKCHEEMNTSVKTETYKIEDLNECMHYQDLEWFYILGFSNIEYNDSDTIENLVSQMEIDRHKLRNCKYFLVIGQK